MRLNASRGGAFLNSGCLIACEMCTAVSCLCRCASSTVHPATEYTLATYGMTASFRPMSNEEERAFALHGETYFTG